MSFVKKLLHSQRGSNVAQAAALALLAAALLGAMLQVVPGLAGATQRSLSCLVAALGGGGTGCSGGPAAPPTSDVPPQQQPSGDDDGGLPPEEYAAPDGTRPLTDEERALAEEIFGPGALDLDAVRITSDGPFLEDRPYVIGNTIHWPGDTIDTAALAHELTHVYQFQQRGWVYLREAAVLQVKYELWRRTGLGSNPYDYGGVEGLEQALEDGKTFGDFNVEQQGAIVEDYWERRQNGQDTSAYDPFIEDLRDGDLEDNYEEPGISLPLPFPPFPLPPFGPFPGGPTIDVPAPVRCSRRVPAMDMGHARYLAWPGADRLGYAGPIAAVGVGMGSAEYLPAVGLVLNRLIARKDTR